MTLSGNPSLRRVVRGSKNGKYTATDENIVSMKSMGWKSMALCAVTVLSAVLSAVLLYYFNPFVNTCVLRNSSHNYFDSDNVRASDGGSAGLRVLPS